MNKLRLLVALSFVVVAGCNETEPEEDVVQDVTQDVVHDTATPDTATPDTATPDDGGNTDVVQNNCLACLAPGQTFLFRTLDVTEPATPEALPNLLNDIWAPDILEYRLNIMLKIDEVIAQEDGGVLLRCSAGSAWHNLAFADVRTLGNTVVPDSFHFALTDLVTTVYFKVNANCDFETINNPDDDSMPAINFRPGPLDYFLICSAGNDEIGLPENTVPIRGLYANGHFDDECTKMEESHLSGCISQNAACEICNMLTAPDYDLWEDANAPDSEVTPITCDESYCRHHCGPMPWTNFGAFVVGVGVPLNCEMTGDDVNDGFRLTAGFWAQSVTYAEPAK